jgi:hypothetical protein
MTRLEGKIYLSGTYLFNTLNLNTGPDDKYYDEESYDSTIHVNHNSDPSGLRGR